MSSLEEVREALEPFALMAASIPETDPDEIIFSNTRIHPPITARDFRRAREALANLPSQDEIDEANHNNSLNDIELKR